MTPVTSGWNAEIDAVAATAPSSATTPLPSQVGPFTILGLLGEGAMGRVYLARETNPPREVALKVVSTPSQHAFERFQREVETLAQLEHIGIARLYGAGVDPSSAQPWLSMERIHGHDLATHCVQQAATLQERVGLLIKVCEAVGHAHSRGVLHRDLKPANILVDASGQPKVLDFGIARLRQSERENLTQAGQVLGTLPYMSPEQLSGSSTADDVRSDVYALGAIAYELLSGQLPHPRLKTSTLFEALSIVRDENPLPLQQLNRSTRGDLATVVMSALAVEPERRYASAQALADDLQRVLSHRPIEARAPSATYVLSRFARRHRVLTTALLGVALILVAATIVSVSFAINAERARGLATQRAAEAEATVNFLDDMLAAANPEQTKGGDVTVLAMLDASAQSLDALREQPLVMIRAARTLSRTYLALARFDQALMMNKRALRALRELPDPPPGMHAEILRERSGLQLGAGDSEGATQSLDEAGSLLRQPVTSEENETAVRMNYSRARVFEETGKPEQAMQALQAFLRDAVTLPDSDRDVESAQVSLVNLWRQAGRTTDAMPVIDHLIGQRTQRLGERDPRTMNARLARVGLLEAEGRFEESAAESKRLLELRTEVLGAEHVDTLTTAQMLANSLLRLGKAAEALPYAESAAKGFATRFGESHAQTQASLVAMAFAFEETGQSARAEEIYLRLIATQRLSATLHTESLSVRNNYAMLLHSQKRETEAVAQFQELLPIVEKQLGRNHPYYAIFQSNYGLCLGAAGNTEQAKRELDEAIKSLQQALGDDHERTRTARERLASLHQGST
jgi:tetratricopeptide (TPR) repeat protein